MVAYPDQLVECEASRDTHAAAWRQGALDTGDVQPGRSRTAFTCRRLPAGHQAVQCMTRTTAKDCYDVMRGIRRRRGPSLPLRRGLKQTSAARRLPTA